MNTETVRERWKKRGFGCGVWTDPPGQVWEDFTHETDELVMVLEGDVEFEIGGRVFKPKAGEELLIPRGVLHSVRNRGKGQSRWLYGYKSD
jgi:quercetin dioxygenase-like cupin family protein